MQARSISALIKPAAASALLLGTMGVSATAPATPVFAGPGPTKFTAVYKVRFGGLKLGGFRIWTNVTNDRYDVWGQGKLTFLTGIIFEIKGDSASSGKVLPAGPQPANFSFGFKTKKGRGQLAMKFDNGAVAQVAAQPALRIHERAVPVTAKHVTGVMDPLTALFFSTESRAPGEHSSACDQRVPIYDGKYRFDIQLTHKKTVRVARKGKSGYRGPAVICKVKFIPVAGHRPATKNVMFFSNTDEIEAWLIPLPHGRAYVPYHVTIPTPYGTAKITSVEFHIERSGQKKIALIP